MPPNKKNGSGRSLSGRLARFVADRLSGREEEVPAPVAYKPGSLGQALEDMGYSAHVEARETTERLTTLLGSLRRGFYERIRSKDPLASLFVYCLSHMVIRHDFVDPEKDFVQFLQGPISIAMVSANAKPTERNYQALQAGRHRVWEKKMLGYIEEDPELAPMLVLMKAFHRAFVQFADWAEEQEGDDQEPLFDLGPVRVPQARLESRHLRRYLQGMVLDHVDLLHNYAAHLPEDTDPKASRLIQKMLPMRAFCLHDSMLYMMGLARYFERQNPERFARMTIGQMFADPFMQSIDGLFSEAKGMGVMALRGDMTVDTEQMAVRDVFALRDFQTPEYYAALRMGMGGQIRERRLEDDYLLDEPEIRYAALKLRDAVLETSDLRAVFGRLFPGIDIKHFMREQPGDQPALMHRLEDLDAAMAAMYPDTALGVFSRGFLGAAQEYTIAQWISERRQGMTLWSIVQQLARLARPMNSAVDMRREQLNDAHIADIEGRWERFDCPASILLDPDNLEELCQDAAVISALRKFHAALRTRGFFQGMQKVGWDLRNPNFVVTRSGEEGWLEKHRDLLIDDERGRGLTGMFGHPDTGMCVYHVPFLET